MRDLDNNKAIIAYYHDKGNKKATYSRKYDAGTKLKQIRDDMAGNNSRIDAIHDLGKDKVKVYRKKYLTESDVRGNPYEERE